MILQLVSKTSLDEIPTFQGGSVKIRINEQKEQRQERRDRNTDQHQEGNPVHTEFHIHPPLFSTCLFIYFTPEGEGEAIDCLNRI